VFPPTFSANRNGLTAPWSGAILLSATQTFLRVAHLKSVHRKLIRVGIKWTPLALTVNSVQASLEQLQSAWSPLLKTSINSKRKVFTTYLLVLQTRSIRKLKLMRVVLTRKGILQLFIGKICYTNSTTTKIHDKNTKHRSQTISVSTVNKYN